MEKSLDDIWGYKFQKSWDWVMLIVLESLLPSSVQHKGQLKVYWRQLVTVQVFKAGYVVTVN